MFLPNPKPVPSSFFFSIRVHLQQQSTSGPPPIQDQTSTAPPISRIRALGANIVGLSN
ncbi:hypothetical protein ERO13_D11G205550v2 [Gossypium hirsutum]|nr:hypothetical protein ERO13_D11G205550v2 [Gossypium hirsutum]